MNPYISNIEKETIENNNYRKVVFTGKMQLVFMKLLPGEEIGEEVHDEHDQFFRIESGIAKVLVDDKEYMLEQDMALIVPAGAKHNIINDGVEDLKLYTIYAPAEHPEGTIQATKP